MGRFLLFLWLIVSFSSLLHSQSATQSAKTLIITHVTVINATGVPPLANRNVVISNHRIASISDSESALPKDARLIDGSGKFLIPGLWDMHVHWYDKDYLSLFLVNGVTGIRIMFGSPLHREFRREIEAGQLIGPRMVIAGPIIDGPVPYWPNSVSVHTVEEARHAVDASKQNGADFIKEYSFLPRDLYFAIADESKKQNISFVGHVPLAVSVEEASDAGQKSMEHLIGILRSCSSREQDFLEAAQADLAEMIANNKVAFEGPHVRQLGDELFSTYDPAKASQLFARFKKNGTWQCPTLTVLRSLAFTDQSSFRDDPRLKYMPPSVRSSWAPPSHGSIENKSPEDYAYSKREFQKDLELVAAMNRAGVDIIAGTDVLNPYCFPGFSLPDELELYVKAGMSPMDALRTATANPARFLGREKDLGTVESGKLADLVLLDANPLDDINNVRKISALIYDGAYFDRAALDGMLANIERRANRKSIADALSQTISTSGIDAAVKQYYDLKSSQAPVYNFDEAELNTLGYKLLGSKQLKEAIRIFQLNVEAYPQSGNVYDSLAEAYMDNGDRQLAIANYQKSLELDPSNKNAVEMLKKLNSPN
jgi:hypothetical protein